MSAFIVRPFEAQRGVDFNRVERELISPALQRLGITGSTTQEIAGAGNIRADMFQLLLTADIVVADISIHNANVFYELGIRHALRERGTFLLRASIDDRAGQGTRGAHDHSRYEAALRDLTSRSIHHVRRILELRRPRQTILRLHHDVLNPKPVI